jgi:glycosyltransferase involved in cell wall biosynthesis
MKSILLSVIIPVYNASHTLAECLQSLHKDLEDRRIEYIIINDGSTDNSVELIEKFKSYYPEQIQILHQKNQGQGKARNHAIYHAQGIYLGFVDADDHIVPGMFTLMLNSILKNNTDMLICDFSKAFENGKQEIVQFNSINTFLSFPKKQKHSIFSSGNSAWNKIFKRSLIVQNNLWFPENMIYEDLAMIPILISKCDTLSRIPKVLYVYHIHQNSTTHNSNKNIDDHLQALNILYQELRGSFYNEVLFLTLKELLFYTLPRYSTILDKDAFQTILSNSVDFFLIHYPDWDKNPYIRSESLIKRIYIFIVLKKSIWIFKLLSKYKTF